MLKFKRVRHERDDRAFLVNREWEPLHGGPLATIEEIYFYAAKNFLLIDTDGQRYEMRGGKVYDSDGNMIYEIKEGGKNE